MKSGAIEIVHEDWAQDWKPENAKKITNAAITKARDFDAILASNDGTAQGAIQALTEEGLAIFQDDLQALLHGGSEDMRSRLTATLENGRLLVQLSLAISGVSDPKVVRRSYSSLGRVSATLN